MKRISLTTWIFIAMVLGVVFGVLSPSAARQLGFLSAIFLQLIKSIVAPLIFATLVYGIAGGGEAKHMGRIGGKAILYFEIATTVALFLGLAVVNFTRPGDGVPLPTAATASSASGGNKLIDLINHSLPGSIVDVLPLVVFAMMFGAACAAVGEKARPVVVFCGSLAEVMFRYTKYVMYLAPLGVGGAIAVTVGTAISQGRGMAVFLGLAKLILSLYGALILFVVLLMGTVIMIFRIPMRGFIRWAREPWLIAFSTASSEAALPLALENMERFGVPKHIAGFVIPTGYSFNLDGTTLYLALASVFVSQAANHPLSFGQQLIMMLTLMLTSKGVAGVPRASLVILSGTLTSFDLPLSGVALILGIDAVMDMARTSVNVLGNCLAAVVVARWEGYKVGVGPNAITAANGEAFGETAH